MGQGRGQWRRAVQSFLQISRESRSLTRVGEEQSALWSQLTQLSSTLSTTSAKVDQLQADVKGLKDSLSTSPQLSSLPKEVADLQGSVVTLGSSLQDVNSALKKVTADHDKLSTSLHNTSAVIDRLKEDVSLLQNQTTVVGGGVGGEDRGHEATVGGAVVALGTRLDTLTHALDTLNSTLVNHSTHSTDNTHRIQSLEQWTNLVTNLSSRMSEVETWQSGRPDTSQLANLTAALSQLKDTSQRHARTLSNITQSVDVVKGVEGKLEGSQVQLANTVSELKQQFQKVEQQVLSMAVATSASTSPPLPPSNETHTRKQRLSQSNPGGGGRDSRGP
ncbi:hypothetical protein Pmani_006175 [Petrolisthes manimaculis]|uniref:Uncharacterized protein n=1 Tax=Petrolisthes manimaculis TaxID=1843537 RepID=A0AAE1QAB4_9EUCA|nr:hypothetical protein Pmani_006175 [Petrolisthes manimaculis]